MAFVDLPLLLQREYLTRMFQWAVVMSDKPDTGLHKKHLGVMIASDNVDVHYLADLYATKLCDIGLTRKNHVVTISWEDLVDKKHDGKAMGLNIEDAFNKAAGGVLLITDAYREYLTIDDRAFNFRANKMLFSKIDASHFDDKVKGFREDADKPVVVLTGRGSALSTVRADQASKVDARFLQRIGI